MRMIARAALVAAVLFGVSGWAADLDELKDTTPADSELYASRSGAL
jgi:hypothetical protein